MTPPPSDHDIIRSVLDGNIEDFAPLVRRHQDHVYGLCFSLMKNPSEAEDAAQDIFLKSFRALGDFRFASSFGTWLYRIAYRHCLDLLKSRRRRKEDSLDDLLDTRGDNIQSFASPDHDDSALWARNALEDLRPEDRLLLTLREIEGFSYEELSSMLNISLEAVKSRIRRARESLRRSARPFPDATVVQRTGDLA